MPRLTNNTQKRFATDVVGCALKRTRGRTARRRLPAQLDSPTAVPDQFNGRQWWGSRPSRSCDRVHHISSGGPRIETAPARRAPAGNQSRRSSGGAPPQVLWWPSASAMPQRQGAGGGGVELQFQPSSPAGGQQRMHPAATPQPMHFRGGGRPHWSTAATGAVGWASPPSAGAAGGPAPRGACARRAWGCRSAQLESGGGPTSCRSACSVVCGHVAGVRACSGVATGTHQADG